MNRKTLITIAAGAAVVAIPAAANATMAYVTVPKNGGAGKMYVTTAGDNGTNPVRITEGTGAFISPDGARLAYQTTATNAQGDPKLYIRDLASGATAQVTGGCIGAITWSPDSKWLACQTQTANAKGVVTGNGLGLLAVPADLPSGGVLPVADYIAALGNNVGYGVAFSPDSTAIAFSQQPWSSKAYAGTLYVAPLSNAGARAALLTRAMSPVWGPAGIAANRYKNVVVRLGSSRTRMVHTQVWVMQPTGGASQLTHYNATGLTSGPAAGVWAPGGNFLAGAIGGEDQSQLATFAVPGGKVRMLEKMSISSPVAVSADGSRVLFESGMDGGDTAVKVIGVNGKGLRTLVKQAGGVTVTAGWNG